MEKQLVTIVMDKDSYKRFKLLVERDTRVLSRSGEKCQRDAVSKGKQPKESRVKPVEYKVISKEKQPGLILPNFARKQLDKTKPIDIRKADNKIFTIESMKDESSEEGED